MMATGTALLTLGSLFLTVVHSSSSCEDTGCSALFSGGGRCVDLGTLDRSSLEEVSLEGCCDRDKCSCVCVSKIQDRAGKRCKTNRKCEKKEGICLRQGSQPKGAKDLGLCDKKTKCRCYKSTPTTTPAATTTPSTGTTSCTGSLEEKMVELLEKVDTMTETIETISETILTMNSTSSPGSCSTTITTPTTTGAPAISGLVLAGGFKSAGSNLSTLESFPYNACAIPPLPEGRGALSLTLLPGDSLVACGGRGTETSCVVWSKGQGDWTHYSTLTEQRWSHTAAAVEGSRVMLLGGAESPNTGEIAGVEGTFPLQNSGYASCTFSVKEGREVVVTGGVKELNLTGGLTTSHAHVDRYYTDGSFLGSLPNMLEGRFAHGCATFSNSTGTFYLVTGGIGTQYLATTEILAPGAGAWAEVAPLPVALFSLQCESPGNDMILCVGGHNGADYTEQVMQYNPRMDNWEKVGKLTGPRSSFAMVASEDLSFCEAPTTTTPPKISPAKTTPGAPVSSGLVLAGGFQSSGSLLKSVESFPYNACTIPPLPEGRGEVSLTLLPGDSLVACGGLGSDSATTSCLVWSKGQADWTPDSTLREERYGHAAVAVEGSRVMLLGGQPSPNTGEIAGVEGTFPLQNRAYGSCAFPVKEGREVVVTGVGRNVTSGVDRYSSDGSYIGTHPNLLEGRDFHGCASFSNLSGTFFLVTGGFQGQYLPTTEILAPGASAWVEVAPLPTALGGLECGSLGDMVVCAGGDNGTDYTDEVVQYNPREDKWTKVGKLSGPRTVFGMVASEDLSFCEDPGQ